LNDHNDWVLSVSFSPNGKYLVSTSENGESKLWDLSKFICVGTLLGHHERVWSACFDHSSTFVITCSDDGTIRTWDIDGNSISTLTGHTDMIWSVNSHPRKFLIVTGSEDKTVKVWDFRNGRCLNTFYGHSDRVREAKFSPDGETVVSCSDDKTIRLWDLTGNCIRIWHGYQNGVWSVDFDANGEMLIGGYDDNSLHLWNIDDCSINKSLEGHKGKVWSVASNHEYFASSSDDKTVKLWSASRGECVDTLAENQNWPLSIDLNYHSDYVAIGCDNKLVKVWDIRNKKVETVGEHRERVWAVALGQYDKVVLSGSEDGTAALWNYEEKTCLRIFTGHQQRIWAVDLLLEKSEKLTSKISYIVATASDDAKVILWNVEDEAPLHVLEGHKGAVRSVAFSPNGQYLVSGGADCSVRLWNVKTGKSVFVLKGHTEAVRSVCFHPNGNLLASGSADGTIKLWDMHLGKCLGTFRIIRPYENTKFGTTEGIGPVQRSSLLALGATVS
jgi:WD40 repeat protein